MKFSKIVPDKSYPIDARQNDSADDILKLISMNESCFILI